MDPLSARYDSSNDNNNSCLFITTSSSSTHKNKLKMSKNTADQDSSSFPMNSISISNNLKMTKAKLTKQIRFCIVCGQQSLYQYYGVQSCEGCKQFFRRAIVKQIIFRCWKSRKCNIMAGERCRGCRLDRCLLMGMDPSLVNVKVSEELDMFITKLEDERLQLITEYYARVVQENPQYCQPPISPLSQEKMASYSKEIDVDMMEPTLSPPSSAAVKEKDNYSTVKEKDNYSSQEEMASVSSSKMLGAHLGGFNELEKILKTES